MAAIVAHHALRHPGRAGGVEDIERIGRRHGHAGHRVGRRCNLLPVEVPTGRHLRLAFRTLKDDHRLRLVRRHPDRFINQRLVGDGAARLQPAGGSEDGNRLRIVDSRRQLFRGKAAEDNRMDGPNPRAGQHRHRRLRHHWHIDEDPVALLDAARRQRPGEAGHDIGKFPIGEAFDLPRHRAVVNQRRLIAPPVFNVTVQTVVAGVEFRPFKPAIERRVVGIEHPVPGLEPAYPLRRAGPEDLRLFQ